MTKLELVNLINMLKYYQKTKNVKELENNIKYERAIFPNIKELEEDFNTLIKELKKIISVRDISKEKIENITKNCKHEIRLVYYGLFGNSYKCPICDKSLSDSDFDLNNKLRSHCVLLPNKYQYDSDDIKDGYDKDIIYNIILDILKDKNDEEEIDLIKEFANLHLKYCKIINEEVEDEKYILIIGGSNIENITNYSFITSVNNINSEDIYDYFKDLLNIRVKYIENEKTIGCKSSVRGDGTIAKESYNSLENLKEILNKETVNYNIIIDATNLYEYIIENNKIEVRKYDLNLKEIFKNSKIVRIEDISKDKSRKESVDLKNKINDLYFEHSDKYYYSDEKDDVNSTCNKIKKLLKKRNLSS